MSELRFYKNVFKCFVKNTFARESDYRGNLIAEIIDSLLNIFVNVYFFKIIFLNTDSIAGWNSDEILVLVAITQIITSVLYMIFMNNLPRIQNYVLRGDLDYILLKPCDSQFYVSFRYFYFGAIPSVFFSLALLVYAAVQVDMQITLIRIAILIVDLLAAITICYSIWFLVMVLSIIFIKIGTMHELFLSSLKFLEYPKNVYKGIIRILMLYVIPIATVSNVPSEMVIGKSGELETLIIVVMAMLFFVLARLSYNLALKRYSSASS